MLGKEANRIEEVLAGSLHDLEEVYNEYRDPERESWSSTIVPVLQQGPRTELAVAAGISSRELSAILSRRAQPRTSTQAALRRAAAAHARKTLKTWKIGGPPDDLTACAVYLKECASHSRPCGSCSRVLVTASRSARYCSAVCRQRAHRAARKGTS